MLNVTLIDNYDSFTWNLVHYLGALGAAVTVLRNDAVSVASVMTSAPDAIVLSPGPRAPKDAGICCDLVRAAGSATPIFGVCLGHQAIGEVFGGTIVRAPSPMHGKLSEILHQGEAVFRGIDGAFQATRYHSLIVERSTLPADLAITATTREGIIMGLSHRVRPIHGVQFHPESILSQHGMQILKNFLDIAAEWHAGHRRQAAE